VSRTALITRPREDCADLALELEKRGYRPLIEPMLTIRFRAGPPLVRDGLQGLLLTSANGARALAARVGDLSGWRDLPVWAVGDASATMARSLGFETVESAGGDVVSLAALVAQRLDPAKGPLLHPAAAALAGDLAGALAIHGFRVEKQVLYDAAAAEFLSAPLMEELRQGMVEIALFFSPRTAATFARLAAGLTQECAALALSPAVAEALGGLEWRRLMVADKPNQSSLLAALDGV